jgi:hypothetical protein
VVDYLNFLSAVVSWRGVAWRLGAGDCMIGLLPAGRLALSATPLNFFVGLHVLIDFSCPVPDIQTG